MTTPQEKPPAPPPVSAPLPRPRRLFGDVPTHLGRARTSTVVLVVLWIAFFVLWIFVRPESAATTPTGSTGSPDAPATTTQAPTTTPAPTTTDATTTPPADTTTAETTTGETTTGETTTPEPTTPGTTAPTPNSVSRPADTTTGSAPGTTPAAPTS